jgi:hypothetical protein
VNRQLFAALLAGLPLALGIGAGTATAQPPVAGPIGSITAPISSAPVYPGLFAGWSFDSAKTLVAISCAHTTDRPAWSMPLVQQQLARGETAGYAKNIPIIDTGRLGSTVEWAAYGADPTVPLIRSGCLDTSGQRGLLWGDPVISERAVVRPPAAGMPLAILPGESAATPVYAPAPPTTPAPATTATTTTTAPFTTSAAAAPTAQAPAYTGTPDTGASSQSAPDSGGGIFGAGILGVGGWAVTLALLTLALVGLSRGNARRMRAGETAVTMRGLLAAGLAVITGLIATAVAATGLPGYVLAAVLAVAVGWTVAHQIASREGHQVALSGLLTASRGMQGIALGGLLAGAAVGYVVAGSSLTSPAEGYSAAVGLCIGGGLITLRQARAAYQRWLSDAELVADLMAVPVRAILEQDEVRFAAQANGGYQVLLLNQAARQHLPGLAERIVQIAPHLDIARADRDGVVLVPADEATVAARESVASSGGLVGGAHSGSDPWAGQPASEAPAEPHTDVNMSKPGSTPKSTGGPLDLSGEDDW